MDYKVAEKIKEIRLIKGMSTNKLSTMAGLSQSYVRKLERGESKPTFETLSYICDAFGIRLLDFLKEDNPAYWKLRVIKLLDSLSEDQLERLAGFLEGFDQ